MSISHADEKWSTIGVTDFRDSRLPLIPRKTELNEALEKVEKPKTKEEMKMLEKYTAKDFGIHEHIKEIYQSLMENKRGPHAFLVNSLHDVPLQTVDFYLPQIW